ncbi:carboxypeptidase regulatory-like domain-containing protein [Aggregicoccus sp. 17bor-14]|uniref:carboxypeptidase-like regulatory domain-containing protein n=1 Tax=Myxococcaceae TaxID=31 RepID=UPI00129C2564|nr:MULTISPECIES: carboxypeptidase regulatory-like domain-containing protein [Myxococcaceae]MBF5045997.1 carboxypeptidase regulatory-like domain-containing protein [Simulacricoccus sp. 17bor-14]MRI91728.1 carboxypeptidase regulatory-like domain-containing protein [Aggregicoccus sp. 17bor-14]
MRTLTAVSLLVLLAACGDGFHNQPLGRAELRGRVVGADPAVASVSVLPGDAASADGGVGAAPLATVGVDAEGRFVVPDVPATRVTLYVVGSPSQALYLTVDLQPAQVTDVGDVTLQSAASLTVVVRDDAGRLLPGAEVDVDGTPFGRQTTDTAGSALFSPVAAACYRIRVRAEGFLDAELSRCVSTGEAVQVDVTLQPKR